MADEARVLRIPDPDLKGGRVRVRFGGFAPESPATTQTPSVLGGTRQVDQVWITYLEGEREGTAALVPRKDVRGLV